MNRSFQVWNRLGPNIYVAWGKESVILVLSRRPDEEVNFPNLGMTLRVLRKNGSVDRLGIFALRQIKADRREASSEDNLAILEKILAEQSGGLGQGDATQANDPASHRTFLHSLRNSLNAISLQLHLFHRQKDAGRKSDADQTFEAIVNGFAALDREIAEFRQLGVPHPVPALANPQVVGTVDLIGDEPVG